MNAHVVLLDNMSHYRFIPARRHSKHPRAGGITCGFSVLRDHGNIRRSVAGGPG